MPLAVTDTRPFFRPLCADIVAVLRRLRPDEWESQTMAGTWRVRDVVAHLIDTALRRLSLHRDASEAPTRVRVPTTEAEFAIFIHELNSAWVRAAERLSPRVLTDLYERTSADLVDFVEQLDLEGPAGFPVSWAGEKRRTAWLDIGREFTEIWHHGAQIREAVGEGAFPEARWLHAVLTIALHALPHTYRDVQARPGQSLVVEISGNAGGTWSLQRRSDRWDITEVAIGNPDAKATMSDEDAWRLFFNALSRPASETVIHLEGAMALARPLLNARSVIV